MKREKRECGGRKGSGGMGKRKGKVREMGGKGKAQTTCANRTKKHVVSKSRNKWLTKMTCRTRETTNKKTKHTTSTKLTV